MNINNTNRLNIVVLFLALWIGICISPAHGHSDVFLSNVGGRVAIGGANELGTVEENFDLTTRVFEGVTISNFPPIGPADYGRDEPGFFALPSGSSAFPSGAIALPGGAGITISLPEFQLGGSIDAEFFWSGTGAVNFVPLTTAQPNAEISIGPSPIGNTGSSGSGDIHPAFKLNISGSGVPADGVYLIAPTVHVAGLEQSQRFYMLFLADALLTNEEAAEELEEALEQGQTVLHGKDFAFFEEAVDYVERLVVPEPASYLMAGLAMLAINAIRVGRRG